MFTKPYKYFVGIIGICFLIINFLGCGKDRDRENKKRIRLTWTGYAFPVYDKFRTEESKKFELIHPEIEVKYEPKTGQYIDSILTAIAGGAGPDMFLLDANYLVDFISRGTLVDLTDWIEEDKEYFKDIYPSLMEASKLNGRYYAIPGNCNVICLYYNKELFDEARLSYPTENWRWEDMLEAAQKLTKRDKSGRIIQFGLGVSSSWRLFFMFQNGGRFWNNDKTECIINSQESIEGLEFYKDLIEKYKVIPKSSDLRSEDELRMFINNRLAMWVDGSWTGAQLSILAKEMDYGITHIPYSKNRFSEVGFNSLVIWSGSKNTRLAYELARFMIRPDAIKFLIDKGDSMPLREKGEEEVDFFLRLPQMADDSGKILMGIMDYAVPWGWMSHPKIPFKEIGHIINKNLEEYIDIDKIAAKQALDNIAKEINLKLNQ